MNFQPFFLQFTIFWERQNEFLKKQLLPSECAYSENKMQFHNGE